MTDTQIKLLCSACGKTFFLPYEWDTFPLKCPECSYVDVGQIWVIA